MELPDCSKWKVWKGLEIEGETSLGVETLFVRNLFSYKNPEDMELLKTFKRVWFTREYTDDVTIEAAIEFGLEVALEVNYEDYDKLSDKIKKAAKIYLVLPFNLPEGTHIKCGHSFQELMGVLKRPTFAMADYNKDTVIKP